MLTMTRIGKTEKGYLKQVTRAPLLLEGWSPCPKKVWKRSLPNPSGGSSPIRYDPFPAKLEARTKANRNWLLRYKDRIRGKRYKEAGRR